MEERESIKIELEKYVRYKATLSIIKKDIIVIKRNYPGISGSNFSINGDIRAKGYLENHIEQDIIEKCDELQELEIEKEELEIRLQLINDLIDTLKPFYKFLIEERYKKNKETEKIAEEIHRQTKSVERSISNAIKKMDKIYLYKNVGRNVG